MRTAYLCSALLLLACVKTTTVVGPDGRAAFYIQCGDDRSRCLAQAGSLCPGGYTVVESQSGESGAIISGTQSVAAVATIQRNDLMVQCRSPAAPALASSSAAPAGDAKASDVCTKPPVSDACASAGEKRYCNLADGSTWEIDSMGGAVHQNGKTKLCELSPNGVTIYRKP